jgi:hypothetical protein
MPLAPRLSEADTKTSTTGALLCVLHVPLTVAQQCWGISNVVVDVDIYL